MTEDERTALVDEMAEAIWDAYVDGEPTFPALGQMGAREQAGLRRQATACLPIIEKLLAAHDEVMLGNAYNKGYRDAVAAHDLDALEALLSDEALVATIRRELMIAYRWGLTTTISTALSTPEQVVDSGTTQIMAAVAKAQGRGEVE